MCCPIFNSTHFRLCSVPSGGFTKKGHHGIFNFFPLVKLVKVYRNQLFCFGCTPLELFQCSAEGCVHLQLMISIYSPLYNSTQNLSNLTYIILRQNIIDHSQGNLWKTIVVRFDKVEFNPLLQLISTPMINWIVCIKTCCWSEETRTSIGGIPCSHATHLKVIEYNLCLLKSKLILFLTTNRALI